MVGGIKLEWTLTRRACRELLATSDDETAFAGNGRRVWQVVSWWEKVLEELKRLVKTVASVKR